MGGCTKKTLKNTLIGLGDLTFGGGIILLKLLDLSYGFEDIDFKIAIFWQN